MPERSRNKHTEGITKEGGAKTFARLGRESEDIEKQGLSGSWGTLRHPLNAKERCEMQKPCAPGRRNFRSLRKVLKETRQIKSDFKGALILCGGLFRFSSKESLKKGLGCFGPRPFMKRGEAVLADGSKGSKVSTSRTKELARLVKSRLAASYNGERMAGPSRSRTWDEGGGPRAYNKKRRRLKVFWHLRLRRGSLRAMGNWYG